MRKEACKVKFRCIQYNEAILKLRDTCILLLVFYILFLVPYVVPSSSLQSSFHTFVAKKYQVPEYWSFLVFVIEFCAAHFFKTFSLPRAPGIKSFIRSGNFVKLTNFSTRATDCSGYEIGLVSHIKTQHDVS